MRHFFNAIRNSRGFTLVEVVLAAGLAVLVLLAALGISWRAWGLLSKDRARFDETTELRSAAMWVTRDLRCAGGVAEVSASRLSLDIDGSTVTYTLGGGKLTREEGGAWRIVARGLTGADFSSESRDGGVLVTVEFAGEKGGKVRTCVWVYTGS